ncbi:MAG: methylated-DNA--[protein]-cysteine S-methyltransferase [Candidatus Dormiibacterota bacterium]|jgi:AraC family transcriptional regulator of adaptative response/methylated-DNA-[protein]-cysteine methyltransferase
MTAAAPASDRLWAAVVSRDSSARFVFGVTSTRVFCRPGCPARTPARDRVVFFEAPNSARAAGFRACRRCHPDAPGATRGAVEEARALLDRRPEGWHVETLARRVGLTPTQLQRRFKKAYGITPAEYSRALRTERARSSLATGANVTEALYDAGFGSGRAFYEVVPAALGMTPSQFRQGGAGVEVRYTVFDSFLGQLLVGATERGVCTVKMGERARALEDQLREQFPSARLTRDDLGLAQVREVAQGLARGGVGREELPLDVHGTVFQWLVWRQIQAIPRGRTKTYGQLASEIGRPAAARAVARACATNQVALLIPCHRVVPAAGGEGGYRWGPDRKRRLLEAEAANP